MKKILILIIISLVFCGCNSTTESYKYSKNPEVEKIMIENNYEIIDVRTSSEYATGHVKGAINIPYDEIDENTKLDKNKTILVYCKSGKRSSIAFETLKKLGFKVYDLGAYETIDIAKE